MIGEMINHQDNLYVVYRKIRQSRIKESDVTKLKEYWNCDIVLKRKNQEDDMYYFLKEISDAIIVDDNIIETPKSTTPIKTPDTISPPNS